MINYTFHCPVCRQYLSASEELLGTSINCPFCHKQITVPQAALVSSQRPRIKISAPSSKNTKIPAKKIVVPAVLATVLAAGAASILLRHAQGLQTGLVCRQDDSPYGAFVRCQKNAESGDPAAQFRMGTYYLAGNIPKPPSRKDEWDSPRTVNSRGKLSWSPKRKEELEMAINWFRQAAFQGNAEAMFKLGVVYSEETPKPDLDQAGAYWLLACTFGHAEALTKLRMGSCGPEKRLVSEKARRMADSVSLEIVRNMGHDVRNNLNLVEEAQDAAVRGRNQGAQFNIAFAYEHGITVPSVVRLTLLDFWRFYLGWSPPTPSK